MKLLLVLTALLAAASVSFAQRYVAEGYFVWDNEAVRSYMRLTPGTSRPQAATQLRTDLNYLLTQTNQMLTTMRPTIDIQIRVRSHAILSTNIFRPGDFVSPGVLDPNRALRRVAIWLLSQNAYRQLKFDFAIFYTGYQLNGVTGTAYIGGVCDNTTAVGLVQANSTFVQAIDTAIQFAHIMGAPNDGPTSQYLESRRTIPTSQNRWSFSDCSATWIRDNVNSLSPNCLTQTQSSSYTPRTTPASYRGSLLDPDTICKRSLNDAGSYACLNNALYNDAPPGGNGICQQIYCYIPGTTLCRPAFPTDGMICGSRKRCNDGQCRSDPSAGSNVDSSCLWGDQEHLDFPSVPFYGTCAQFISQYGLDECYTPLVSQICCQTCKRCTGPRGCECGDKSSQCRDHTQNAVCPANSDVCCAYCRGYVGKRSIRLIETHGVNITIDRIQETELAETMYNVTDKLPPLVGY